MIALLGPNFNHLIWSYMTSKGQAKYFMTFDHHNLKDATRELKNNIVAHTRCKKNEQFYVETMMWQLLIFFIFVSTFDSNVTILFVSKILHHTYYLLWKNLLYLTFHEILSCSPCHMRNLSWIVGFEFWGTWKIWGG